MDRKFVNNCESVESFDDDFVGIVVNFLKFVVICRANWLEIRSDYYSVFFLLFVTLPIVSLCRSMNDRLYVNHTQCSEIIRPPISPVNFNRQSINFLFQKRTYSEYFLFFSPRAQIHVWVDFKFLQNWWFMSSIDNDDWNGYNQMFRYSSIPIFLRSLIHG